MPETTLTWLGHSSFRFDSPGGKRVYVDPFLNGNPKCPESELEPERVEVIAVTHAHGDHLGDTVELAKKHGCTVIAAVELAWWLQGKHGLENVLDPNKGGTVEAAGDQVHADERAPLELEQRPRVHGGAVRYRRRGRERDEALLRRRHLRLRGHGAHPPHLRARRRDPPDRRPLHDGSSRGGSVALELLGTKRCVPCHYGTFPPLVGTPAQLQELAPDVQVDEIEPGDSVTL